MEGLSSTNGSRAPTVTPRRPSHDAASSGRPLPSLRYCLPEASRTPRLKLLTFLPRAHDEVSVSQQHAVASFFPFPYSLSFAQRPHNSNYGRIHTRLSALSGQSDLQYPTLTGAIKSAQPSDHRPFKLSIDLTHPTSSQPPNQPTTSASNHAAQKGRAAQRPRDRPGRRRPPGLHHLDLPGLCAGGAAHGLAGRGAEQYGYRAVEGVVGEGWWGELRVVGSEGWGVRGRGNGGRWRGFLRAVFWDRRVDEPVCRPQRHLPLTVRRLGSVRSIVRVFSRDYRGRTRLLYR